MCQQVEQRILFQQCKQLYTSESPITAYPFYDTYAYKFVYVELRATGDDLIIETITKLEDEITNKRRVFPKHTPEFEAIRKAINVFDKLSINIDALVIKKPA